jgi:hypothetical protein
MRGAEPSDVDRRPANICLTLMMSKPRSTSPSEMFWAGAFGGRWRITALGKKVKYERLLSSRCFRIVMKSTISLVTILVALLVLRNSNFPDHILDVFL